MSMLDPILAGIRQIIGNGVIMPARNALHFHGAVSVTDDDENARTDIAVLGAEDIAELEADVAALQGNVATLQTNLTTTQADVDASEAAIAANAANIAANASGIAANAASISSLTTALGLRVKTRLAIEVVASGSSRTLAVADFPADENKLLVINSAINFTLLCPQNSDAAIAVGASVAVLRYHSQTLAIAAGTGATNRPAASVTVSAQYKLALITKLNTNEYLITGDIS